MLSQLPLFRIASCLWGCLSAASLFADPPRIITCGWNAPTTIQFARDASRMQSSGFSGAVLDIRSDAGMPHPFWSAHSSDDWSSLTFGAGVDPLRNADVGKLTSAYLLVKANPGDVDWLDDEGWAAIVDHWRIAARIAKRGKLRGLLFDPEPYSEPFRQFQYSRQEAAIDHSFEAYRAAARKRGREVMTAVIAEFPEAELVSYFLMSYLVRDHRYRGPSPVGRSDEAWCLAGHSYGLLPAFLDGWLDVLPPTVTLFDGCEYAYWHKSANDFAQEADDVRRRGVQLVSPENRDKYAKQLKVAFPIYMDAMHPDLAGRYTLEPESPDRLALLRRNLAAAIDYGDGLVWIYGEHGRWWPEPGETALWHNKDVYPEWPTLIPGCDVVLKEVVEATGTRPVAKLQPLSLPDRRGATRNDVAVQWSTWVGNGPMADTPSGDANVSEDIVVIRGAAEAAGLATVTVEPNEQFCVSVHVQQTGRALTSLAVQFKTADGKWLESNSHNVVAFPEDGVPESWRAIHATVTVPQGIYTMVVICSAVQQWDQSDVVQFKDLQIERVTP